MKNSKQSAQPADTTLGPGALAGPALTLLPNVEFVMSNRIERITKGAIAAFLLSPAIFMFCFAFYYVAHDETAGALSCGV